MRPPSATAALPSSELGARLRERRQALGMSQREVAERVGVSKRGYLAWERAESGITWENLAKLSDVLEATEDWLKLGDELGGFPAGPAAADAARELTEIRNAVVHDPAGGTPSPIVVALLDIQARLERIEAALEVEHGLGDDTRAAIDATRSTKGGASASAGDAAQETAAADGTRDAGDATAGSPRARRAGKRSSGR